MDHQPFNRRGWIRLGFSAAAAMLAIGCSEETGPLRLPVSGQVMLDGKPLSAGTITFLPAGKGPASSSEVKEGDFAVALSEGLVPGPHDVAIVSIQETGKQVKSPDDPTATIDEVRNIIPARYSSGSQLRIEVKPDRENSFRFDLSSEKDAPRGRRVSKTGSNSRHFIR